ncbi:hypothetical protein QBC46DRAFT_22262 [Diplogelasinospora grovesii]|uniref:Uncharacterized protein n=1 Tax=Diplogelasinospora grovesii TaxID=303347 RepID=A0AAN6NEX8_9PEZI|nr:hypothetical protein QBC46DRAFT_22262 [Diplogelasinospora grovesii]
MDSRTATSSPAGMRAAAPTTFSRRPRMILLGLTCVAVGFGFQSVSQKMKQNELAQRAAHSGEQPNFYVSVDRSGGGV